MATRGLKSDSHVASLSCRCPEPARRTGAGTAPRTPSRGGRRGRAGHWPAPARCRSRRAGRRRGSRRRGPGERRAVGGQALDREATQDEVLLVVLAAHGDADQRPHRAAAAVAADDGGGSDQLDRAGGAVGHGGGDTVGVLVEADQLPPELDGAAQLRQPRPQHLLRPPLRQHDQVRIRDPRLRRARNPAGTGHPSARIHAAPHLRRRPSAGLDGPLLPGSGGTHRSATAAWAVKGAPARSGLTGDQAQHLEDAARAPRGRTSSSRAMSRRDGQPPARGHQIHTKTFRSRNCPRPPSVWPDVYAALRPAGRHLITSTAIATPVAR